jgi:hypothetical protein
MFDMPSPDPVVVVPPHAAPTAANASMSVSQPVLALASALALAATMEVACTNRLCVMVYSSHWPEP